MISIKEFIEWAKVNCWNIEGNENWWNRYFPILMSVDNVYSFYAIDMKSESGTIVYGCEPEFEVVALIFCRQRMVI